MYLIKNLEAAESWRVYHVFMDATAPEDYTMYLDSEVVRVDSADNFNDTAPTTTVFSIGTGSGVNQSTKSHVAYAFAEIEGYSKFGSYEGNANQNGPVIYTGFTPAFLMTKGVDSAQQWNIYDNKRTSSMLADGGNEGTTAGREIIYADANSIEVGSAGNIDFLANGFKPRDSANSSNVASTFIFMAFASNPFGGASTTPATAV